MSFFDRVLRRRSHYRATFKGPSSQQVLADLKRFCRYGQAPTVLGLDRHVDPFATGVVVGRQEVFARIVGHLTLDDADLVRLREEFANDD